MFSNSTGLSCFKQSIKKPKNSTGFKFQRLNMSPWELHPPLDIRKCKIVPKVWCMIIHLPIFYGDIFLIKIWKPRNAWAAGLQYPEHVKFVKLRHHT